MPEHLQNTMLNFVLSDKHKALLLQCQLIDIEAVLMIDAPSEQVAKELHSFSQEWATSGSPYQVFYTYLNGELLSEFSLPL
ncbi:hypothetical protein NDI52_28475 [Leptolyngbya sp. PL-A3]